MRIRKVKTDDINEIAKFKKVAFENLGNYHTKDQIRALINSSTVKKLLLKLKDRNIFCSFSNSEITGVIELKGNKIYGLCVKHSHQKKGIGKSLVLFVEDYAKKRNILTITLKSTSPALKLYKSLKYKEVSKEDIKIEGVNFPVTVMEKELR